MDRPLQNREGPQPTAGRLPRSLSKLVEDFNSMGPARYVVAGQLTQLMLLGTESQEFAMAFNNAGNDDFDVAQRWAMYELYGKVKSLYRGALPSLQDLNPEVLNTSLNEIIRSLFKGEIPLEGMDSIGFSVEVRRLATRLMAA